MTFPGGLLDQSAIQRLMASMQGGTQNTVQAPNLGGLMAPQIQPTPPFNPNVDARGRHDHRSGIRGSILHAVGADKVAPELASLLTPDQQARVQPGLMATIGNAVIRGKTPAQVQQERALNLLGLQDAKKARDKQARDEAMWGQIQEVAAQIPDPQARLEYTARMASSMGLAQGADAGLTAQRLRPEAVKILGPQSMAIDPNTGETVAQGPEEMFEEREYRGGVAKFRNGVFHSWILRPASERDASVGDALNAQREFQRVQGLRDDYANNPTIKRAADYASAFQGIQAAAANNDPQSNLAMMYEAVKMRDPNAVREGELALQRSARSVPGWLYGYWEKASKGNVLTPTERAQIVEWARQKIVEQDKVVRPIQAEFGGAARRFGVEADSSFIAPSPFRGTGVVEPKAAPQTLRKTTMPKPANATDAEWAAFLLTRGEKP